MNAHSIGTKLARVDKRWTAGRTNTRRLNRRGSSAPTSPDSFSGASALPGSTLPKTKALVLELKNLFADAIKATAAQGTGYISDRDARAVVNRLWSAKTKIEAIAAAKAAMEWITNATGGRLSLSIDVIPDPYFRNPALAPALKAYGAKRGTVVSAESFVNWQPTDFAEFPQGRLSAEDHADLEPGFLLGGCAVHSMKVNDDKSSLEVDIAILNTATIEFLAHEFTHAVQMAAAIRQGLALKDLDTLLHWAGNNNQLSLTLTNLICEIELHLLQLEELTKSEIRMTASAVAVIVGTLEQFRIYLDAVLDGNSEPADIVTKMIGGIEWSPFETSSKQFLISMVNRVPLEQIEEIMMELQILHGGALYQECVQELTPQLSQLGDRKFLKLLLESNTPQD